MILVNHDESLLQLGSLDFETIPAVAVSMKQSDGLKLINLVKNEQTTPVQLEITSRVTKWEQCVARIDYFMQTNAPLAAYETFYNCIAPLGLNFSTNLKKTSNFQIFL